MSLLLWWLVIEEPLSHLLVSYPQWPDGQQDGPLLNQLGSVEKIDHEVHWRTRRDINATLIQGMTFPMAFSPHEPHADKLKVHSANYQPVQALVGYIYEAQKPKLTG